MPVLQRPDIGQAWRRIVPSAPGPWPRSPVAWMLSLNRRPGRRTWPMPRPEGPWRHGLGWITGRRRTPRSSSTWASCSSRRRITSLAHAGDGVGGGLVGRRRILRRLWALPVDGGQAPGSEAVACGLAEQEVLGDIDLSHDQSGEAALVEEDLGGLRDCAGRWRSGLHPRGSRSG